MTDKVEFTIKENKTAAAHTKFALVSNKVVLVARLFSMSPVVPSNY